MTSYIKELNKDAFITADKMSVEELEELILKANDAFFNSGNPIISDAIFDMLVDFLKLKNSKSKVLKQIGSQIKDPKLKQELPYKLYSMDKKKQDKEINDWFSKYDAPYIVSMKLDGLSGSIVYTNDGKINFNSRGSATHGLNLNKLLKYLPNIPTWDKIKSYCDKNNITGNKNLFAVRGEIIMPKKLFKKNWKDKKSNARNATGGLINSKTVDPRLAKDTRFLVYEILDPEMTYDKQFKLAKKMGFDVVYNRKFKSLDYEKMSEFLKKMREEYDYEIDGIIITNTDLHKRDNTGNPKYAFAFKTVLEDQVAESEIKDIEWHISKDGFIKPVAVIKPVSIGGVTIQRVTLINAKYVKDNKIEKGVKIIVERSGDVIPKVTKILKMGKKADMPKNVNFHWNETGVDIICDDCDNKEVQVNKIYYFFSKLNTSGMGKKNVEKLFDAGYNTILKILEAKKKNFMELDGFKDKSSEKLVNSIKVAMSNIKLEDLMGASNKLGRGIGSRKAKTVLDVYPNLLKDYKDWSKSQFIEKIKSIDGWEEKTSKLFVENFKDFMEFYNSIDKYITISNPNKKQKKSKFTGLTIVTTGFRFSKILDKLESLGIKITNSVSKNTDYVVIKDESMKDGHNSKVKKAKKLNLKILTKGEFEKMINGKDNKDIEV
jgi:NAD-dependent DNA ligase